MKDNFCNGIIGMIRELDELRKEIADLKAENDRLERKYDDRVWENPADKDKEITYLKKENASLKIVEEFLSEHSHELCDELIADKKTIAELKAEVDRWEALARVFQKRSFKLHKKIQLSRKPANNVGELFDVGTKDDGGTE